jgi:hypothetical protein
MEFPFVTQKNEGQLAIILQVSVFCYFYHHIKKINMTIKNKIKVATLQYLPMVA